MHTSHPAVRTSSAHDVSPSTAKIGRTCSADTCACECHAPAPPCCLFCQSVDGELVARNDNRIAICAACVREAMALIGHRDTKPENIVSQ